MSTVGHPVAMTPPCAVISPIRAAGMYPIITVVDPCAIKSGGPTHVQRVESVAAGMPPIMTVVFAGGKIGPPTWGIGGVPGVAKGHVCKSPERAAGFIYCIAANGVTGARAELSSSVERLVARAQRLAGRSLSQEERTIYRLGSNGIGHTETRSLLERSVASSREPNSPKRF